MNKQIKKAFAGTMALLLLASTPIVPAVNASASSLTAPTMHYLMQKEVKLNKTSMTLAKGYKFTLSLNTDEDVTFKSADSSIATVNSSGKVVGKKVGKTKIYATSGGKTYSCTVTVVASKISLSGTKAVMDEGASKKVNVSVKGEKKLKATVTNKNIATVSWVGSWEDNSISLKITGHEPGTTSVKVYNPDYPDTYKTIYVTVNGTEEILSEVTSVVTTAGEPYTFKVYSDADSLSVISSNTDVVVPYITKKNGYFEVTVAGYTAGNAQIAIYNIKDRNQVVSIPVTVKSDIVFNNNARYYVEKVYDITNPDKVKLEAKSSTDKIAYWADENTSQLKYMLVPYSYIPESDNVYCVSLNATVPYYNALDAEYYYEYMYWGYKGTDYYSVRNLDIVHPSANKIEMIPSDKIAWTIKPNGIVQYMVLPYTASVNESEYPYILNADGSSYLVSVDYYKVVKSLPRKKDSSDIVLSWMNYNGQKEYMIVPYNYDEVKAETAKAKSIERYEYYTVYSAKPLKRLSSDIVISYWHDNDEEYHYILVPFNYNENKVETIQNRDLAKNHSYSNADMVRELLNAINAERRKSGISELVTNTELNNAVATRTTEIKERYSHKRPDGTIYSTALDAAGVNYSTAEEILIDEVEYPYEGFEALINDSDFRNVILSSLNKKIGIGYNSYRNAYVIIITD